MATSDSVQSIAVFGSATYRNASVYLLEDPSFTLSVHRQTDSQGHLKIPAGGRYAVGGCRVGRPSGPDLRRPLGEGRVGGQEDVSLMLSQIRFFNDFPIPG